MTDNAPGGVQGADDWPEPGREAEAGRGAWRPVPHGGEYDAEATAFVQLPPEGDADAPLAAPGHGYVPPMITPLQPDPAVAGTWGAPDPQADQGDQHHYGGGYGQDPYAQHGVQDPYGTQDMYAQDPYGQAPYGHDPAAQQYGAYAPQQHAVPQHDPGATGHWDFTEALDTRGTGLDPGAGAADEPPQEAQAPPQPASAGQWRIPLATGDVLDDSGELSAALAASPWNAGVMPPATLPGGARAPWAPEPEPEPEPQAPSREEVQHGWAPTADAAAEAREAVRDTGFAPAGDGTGHEPPLPDERDGAVPDLRTPDGAAGGAAAAATGEQGAAEPVTAGEEGLEDAGQGPEDAAGQGPEDAGQDREQDAVRDEPASAGAADGTGAGGAADGPGTADREPTEAEAPAEGADGIEDGAGAVAVAVDGSEGGAGSGAEDGVLHADGAPEAAGGPEHSGTQGPSGGPEHSGAPGPSDVPEPGGAAYGREFVAAQVPGPHPAEAPAPGEESADQPFPDHDEVEHPTFSYVLRVNGQDRPVNDAWIGESLLYVLRERLGLAGAKDGCSQGECGACNVQVDGRLVASCLVPAATTAGSEVRTVEGLAANGEPSDVQRALAARGVQCGFCIPGMAMTVHDLLEGNHAPSELETRQALSGNLCRCSGYRGVLEAVDEVVAERAAAVEAAHAAEPAHLAPSAPGAGTQGTGESGARIPHQAPPGAGGVQAPHGAHEPQGPHHPHANDGGMA
ncbi:2Fe-2S iron-sulfur cluster-binding protein [Streptomyces tremellae]|uniref:(2Fe-2S)-binding protein n=1 Tax=Streptomyces tremellae TaxID=1124239 RepID=A0ABP7GBC8_9ACTN